jgi:TolB protein
MPDVESFDAFYARTVGNITSQMHALAGDDSAADHALREAYARAYQQWFQIAGNPDPEGWVLAVAKDAYQRRRPMAAAPVLDQARPGHDPLSMPGMFRPPVRPEPAGTGDTTLPPPAGPGEPAGNWFTPASRSDGAAEDAGGNGPARGISGVFGGPPAAPASVMATAQLPGGQPALTAPPAERGEAWWPPGPAGPAPRYRRPPARRPSVTLIVLVVAVAMAVAGGVTYLLTSRHPGGSAAGHNVTTGHHKPAVHMLPAGQTGSLSAIPWSIVGAGWTLAEVSAAAPDANGGATTGGTITTYLVDPEGGKYQIQMSAGPPPLLLAWSGNAQNALLEVLPPSGTGVSFELLSLTTGSMSALPLPAGVTAVGFTRPDGLNILAVDQTATAFQLERFNLQGAFQATIGSLPVKPGVTPSWENCGAECGALSSPDGLYAVFGVTGDQMQFLGNAGGPVIRRLVVPDSGSPPSCVPLTWWSTQTVLANCSVTGSPYAGRLWLVPTDGSSPTALTGPSGSGSGSGVLTGAWQAAGKVYVNETSASQCPSAASGPGGLAVATVSGGALQPITVGGTTNNHTSVVSAFHGQLLLLAQTGCPGTYSLLWLNPSTGATQTVLPEPTSQAGVVAAVPYGNGPTAIRGG